MLGYTAECLAEEMSTNTSRETLLLTQAVTVKQD